MCKCVLYYCHRVSTQLQLTNIPYSRRRSSMLCRWEFSFDFDVFRYGGWCFGTCSIVNQVYLFCLVISCMCGCSVRSCECDWIPDCQSFLWSASVNCSVCSAVWFRLDSAAAASCLLWCRSGQQPDPGRVSRAGLFCSVLLLIRTRWSVAFDERISYDLMAITWTLTRYWWLAGVLKKEQDWGM
jgi:hypothetical protein